MTQDLIQGANEFKRYQYEEQNDLMARLTQDGQNPKYFIISCIDSRANPSIIFRARPGLFFAHKAMGAIVRPYKQGTALAAALQFSLNYNQVDTIIVLGHTQCGAIKALAENLDDPEISSFISVAKDALNIAKCHCKDHEAILARTEQETVLQSIKNLKHYPSVENAIKENRVTIKPWLFDIKTGDLLEYSETKEKFITINEPQTTEDSRQNA